MREPYYQDDACTLYHGDCREILPELAPCWYSVITDPPYGIVNKFQDLDSPRGNRRLSWDWDTASISDTVVSIVRQSCETASSAFVFCGGDQLSRITERLRDIGMTPKNAAWVKTCPPPAGMGNWWPSGFELAIYAYRSGAWFGDSDPKRSNVFLYDSLRHGQPDKNGHPTQKPLPLMKRIIASMVPSGEACLDPFSGSGTTLRAAKDLGRKAIGIELEEKYCEITARRLEQGALFTAGALA